MCANYKNTSIEIFDYQDYTVTVRRAKRKEVRKMVYTNEVKKELDAILKAFENYIDGQDYFDIVYSKKIGYVWILADEPGAAGAEQLDTPEAMLDNLFNDIINDVVAPRSTTHLNEMRTMTESEEAECRRRITAILETIEGGGAEYLEYLDEYIQDYQERYAGDGGSC